MAPDRPVFVLAPPRSGTTLVYRTLARHPCVGYFNRANRKLPNHPRLALCLTRLGLFRDTVRESRRIWERFSAGPGGTEDDERKASDATPASRAWFERAIAGVLRARGATRFVAKLPSHSVQVPWLAALFGEARFLVVERDWRAVVASTVVKRARDFGGDWFGVRPAGWKAYADKPPAVGAAWQYLEVHRRLEEEERRRPDAFSRIRYETLCTEPHDTLDRLAAEISLPFSPAIAARMLPGVGPLSQRWRETLTEDTISEVRAELGAARLLPYEVGAAGPVGSDS